MMTNQDIDECLTAAEHAVDENLHLAFEEFYRPDVEIEAMILWADLPEAVRQEVRARAPEAVKRIEELFNRR
jgi:hypothetical protein